MPDFLLTEAGDRLLQQDGSRFVLELRPRGTVTTPRVVLGASVSPLRSAGEPVTLHIARAPRVSPELGVGT